jgi:hypothetical protein
MSEEILIKLHTALYSLSPLASERERIIAEMGETIWLEALARVLEALPEATSREVVESLNADELDKAIEIADAAGVDVEAILTEVATSVMDEVVREGEK